MTNPSRWTHATGRQRSKRSRRPRPLRRLILAIAFLPFAYYLLCVAGLVYLRFLPPLATGVQLQRAVEQLVRSERPAWHYRWRPTERISPHLPRAVVAAEDARFYQHEGFDWEELRRAGDHALAGGSMRGASTLTQQLIKNLYFTTHRNLVRKAYEWALTPPAEWILGKDRIVELYINVVELGPGIYGAEAAALHHYGVGAASLSRHQAASLAAILPAPLKRRPQNMEEYALIIEQRMGELGW
jgi:monofunctional biosynthetic peptidoglycan transglycosylase